MSVSNHRPPGPEQHVSGCRSASASSSFPPLPPSGDELTSMTEAGEFPGAMTEAGELELDAPPIGVPEALLPSGLMDEDETILLLLRPSPLYVLLAPLGGLVVIVAFTFFMAYLARLPWIGWIPWTDRQALLVGFALVVLRVSWQAVEWYCRVYVLTDRRVIRRAGVLRMSIFETPLSHIQHTSIFASVRERCCGLGTIGFATSGSDVFDAFWMMVAQPYTVHRTVVKAIKRYGKRK